MWTMCDASAFPHDLPMFQVFGILLGLETPPISAQKPAWTINEATRVVGFPTYIVSAKQIWLASSRFLQGYPLSIWASIMVDKLKT